MSEKVVLAYSGGLDTSVILKWLIEEKGYEVHTFTADLGQDNGSVREDNMDEVKAKAIRTGAKSATAKGNPIINQSKKLTEEWKVSLLKIPAIAAFGGLPTRVAIPPILEP